MTSSRQRSREYRGSCHCGALGFVYRTALELRDWPIRACQCTFCRAHGGLTTSDPEGSLVFIEHEPAMVHRYQFGKKITDFMICRRCGAYIGAAIWPEEIDTPLAPKERERLLLALRNALDAPRAPT